MRDENFYNLNNIQKQAAGTLEGPVLIFAGAGSGKTKTLTSRIGNMIQRGVAPESILAITFTNKAAEEMKTRLELIVKNQNTDVANMFIGTFHKLGAKILRENAALAGISKNFTIYDENDQAALINSIIKERPELGKTKPSLAANRISKAKNELIKTENFSALFEENFINRLISQVYELYEQELAKRNALDFDDLLKKPIELFEKFSSVLERYQDQWRYISVDEYQDTNKAQYVFLKLLAARHRNICCVGDDGQSIYSFRGADFRNILHFEKDWPDAKIFFLEQNYRSTKTILNAANAILAKNVFQTQKNLWTNNGSGESIRICEARNEKQEAHFIAQESLALNSAGTPLNSIAVLYRTNAQSRAIEEAMLTFNIPYRLIGGVKFYNRKEIKDLIAYLCVVHNPSDWLNFQRALTSPERGIGKKTLEKIKSVAPENRLNSNLYAGKTKIGIEAFKKILDSIQKNLARETLSRTTIKLIEKIDFINYLEPETEEGRKRIENVYELITVLKSFDAIKGGEALEKFLDNTSLIQNQEAFDGNGRDAVNLMTIHAAKGLEFEHIFLAGYEENLFPHQRAIKNPFELEEERRLAYVAITRAKKSATIIYARHRHIYGGIEWNAPSRFIAEIPQHLIKFEIITDDIDNDDNKVISI